MQPSEQLLLATANFLEPATVRVVLRQADSEYEKTYPPKNVADFQAWLAAAIAEVPEEFRAAAMLEFTAESGYEDGDIYRGMKFYYARPETEAEFAARVHETAMHTVRCEAQERQQLERLQAKYGKS